MSATKLKILGICFIVLNLLWTNAWSDSITNVKISVERPAHLTYGERILVTFEYATRHTGGVRIFVRPENKQNKSLKYSAHGSKIYNSRRGRGQGFFTITSGAALVNQIRINIVSSAGKQLFSRQIPTSLKFSRTPVPITPVLKVLGTQQFQLLSTQKPTGDGGVTRTILPNGDVQISYSDGRKKILYEGGYTIIYPDGREEKASYYSVQPDTPPALPAEQSIVNWLNGMNKNLLNTISLMVHGDQNAVDYYVQKETAATSSLYEKMQLRTAYIDRLLTN